MPVKNQMKQASPETSVPSNTKSANSSMTPGVVYLGRIPHGFYEKEMTSYFSQFGKVTRLRLSRNKKTGNSKHYAFIEFENEDVAKIVAETMDGYLLFNHMLKCSVVPSDDVHADLFKGAGKKFKAIPWNKIQRERQNKEKTEEEAQKNLSRLLAKESKKRKQLEALGIDYVFEGYAGTVEKEEVKAEKEETKEPETVKATPEEPEKSSEEKITVTQTRKTKKQRKSGNKKA